MFITHMFQEWLGQYSCLVVKVQWLRKKKTPYSFKAKVDEAHSTTIACLLFNLILKTKFSCQICYLSLHQPWHHTNIVDRSNFWSYHLFTSPLLSNGLPPKFYLFIFYFSNGPFWLAHYQEREKKPRRFLKITILCKDGVLPIWLTYIDEKGRTLGKVYGIKWGANRNAFGKHIWNLRNNMKNPLKTREKTLGIWWEHKNF
jgi:hypothetical protein